MKKIAIIICVLLVASLFLAGCTGGDDTNTDTNQVYKVSNQGEADQTINDIGTDLGGISNSLDDITNTLTQ